MLHEKIKKKLDTFIEKNKIPHIIFYGPLGSGKRHIMKYFIDKIYINQDRKQYVMNVDCAHGKGIRFIRDELKFFAKTNIQNNNGCFFKSIILLNAHKLTIDAQSALRRCIELFSHTTRFFIIVSNTNKLLNPILSRFCIIYIPLPFIGKKRCSLYDLKKNKLIQDNQNNWLIKTMKETENYNSLKKCWNLSKKIYNKGYSVIDLLKLFEKNTKAEEKYIILLHFDKIKKEYRNEKLLILYFLYIAYLRRDYNLEI